MADGGLIVDRELRIIYFSDGASDIFGFDAVSAVGLTIDLLRCPVLTAKTLAVDMSYYLSAYLNDHILRPGIDVQAGAVLMGKNERGSTVLFKARLSPLLIDTKLCLVVFLALEQGVHNPLAQEHDPTHGDSSIGGQVVTVGNWFTRLSVRTQLLLLGAALIFLTVWISPGLAPHLLKKQESPTNTPPNVQREGGTTRIRVGG